jgi:hypothetical protein
MTDDVQAAIDDELFAPLRVKENVARAKAAWDNSIRFAMLNVANVGAEADRVSTSLSAPLIRVKGGDLAPEIKSGIMLGNAFDDLSREERLRVVKAWIAESGEAV